jgi:hypothetical protein
MGLPMKQEYSHSAGRKIIGHTAEIPSPPPSLPGEVLEAVQVRGEPTERGAGPAFQGCPKPRRAKKQPPAWKNMTLDELKGWLADAKRQQEDQNPEIGCH